MGIGGDTVEFERFVLKKRNKQTIPFESSMNVDVKTTRDYFLSQLLTRTVDRQWLKFSRSGMKRSRHAKDEQEPSDRTHDNQHSNRSELSGTALSASCCRLSTHQFYMQTPTRAALAATLIGMAHTGPHSQKG